ncbi:hypothetical protein PYCCODRAFT_1426780 [Trametes coccinea BRFM310]|uniref:Uncharacterized protein n=1 Tax=Trametes coccinea (strain BRFM310) TaxID=1353009 RepID=A0A1Y2IFS9_TRAC3|nr:hypothetical protein PYCCODRAFT_1426780 [Trametes coccinea BRFM310]
MSVITSMMTVDRRSSRPCVLWHRELLIQIGWKSQTANVQETARRVTASIEDTAFWTCLKRVEAHLRPLAMATNILQAKHTYMDHVLITLVNLHCIYNTDNIKPDVKDQMLSHLELQWKKGAGEDQI